MTHLDTKIEKLEEKLCKKQLNNNNNSNNNNNDINNNNNRDIDSSNPSFFH